MYCKFNQIIFISIFFLILLTPFSFIQAKTFQADFLKPKIFQVHKQLICTEKDQTNCSSIFLIKGKNFINSYSQAVVKIDKEEATILRKTDTFIVAKAGQEFFDKNPSVVINTNIPLPSFVTNDLVLNSLFDASVKTALNSIRTDENGNRYLIAGDVYQNPERTYYRDSYWLSNLLLYIEPTVVRDQIIVLAKGIKENGSVPSAHTIDPNASKLSLWDDHFDSGPYFILLVYDYLVWTGDNSILSEKINNRSIYEVMEDILVHLASTDTNGNMLPEKPNNSLQDWLDNVPRGGEVLYNEILYKQALERMVDLSQIQGEKDDEISYKRLANIVHYQIQKSFWNPSKGYYFESCLKDVCIDRITNDSSLAILYDILPKKDHQIFLQNLSQRLETRYFSGQPYGDWGVMNASPLYSDKNPYVYQNGADWPFLDGINAGARLKVGNSDWYYPLTRWWTYLQKKQPGAVLVEYVSPLEQYGSLHQAWSVLPAASLLRYGLGLEPDLKGNYKLKTAPCFELRNSKIDYF